MLSNARGSLRPSPNSPIKSFGNRKVITDSISTLSPQVAGLHIALLAKQIRKRKNKSFCSRFDQKRHLREILSVWRSVLWSFFPAGLWSEDRPFGYHWRETVISQWNFVITPADQVCKTWHGARLFCSQASLTSDNIEACQDTELTDNFQHNFPICDGFGKVPYTNRRNGPTDKREW